MTTAWTGADPIGFNDPGTSYELGTRFTAHDDVTISKVRVWAPATSAVVVNRKGYIWTTGAVILGTATLPDTLPSGWSSYDLAVPVNISSGVTFWVTYGTLEDYGALNPAGYSVFSADAALEATLGGYAFGVGNLPANTGNTFYGVDVDYALTSPSVAPVVGVTLTQTGLDVSATLTVTDDDPGTVTYKIEWGDGSQTLTSSLGPHAHTYAAAGLYVVLVTATDVDDNTDSAAAAVLLEELIVASSLEIWNRLTTLLNVAVVAVSGCGVPVGRSGIVHGEAVWDECCEGYLYLRVVQTNPMDPFPSPTQAMTNCPIQLGSLIEIGILRCAPMMDHNGRAPSAAAQTAFAKEIIVDKSILYDVLISHDPDWSNFPIVITSWTPLDIQGDCGGGAWQFYLNVVLCPCGPD